MTPCSIILLVDDEPTIRLSIGDALRNAGYEVSAADDGDEALKLLAKKTFDVVVSDIRMPGVDGLTLFRKVREQSPGTEVILMTAHASVVDAVTALKEGARDYLLKPFDDDELLVRVQRLDERLRLNRELREARAALASQGGHSTIIGASQVMVQLLKRIETIAPSDASVVIVGESGTGKELVAKALHSASSRKDRPFVAVNCSAFPETLIEAELFGHERGAFTGATARRDGRFKAANGGTLFLDEVGEIPAMVQAKLLRVLQEGTIEPLGTNTPIKVDVRVICATHRNLKTLIAEGSFREDLYYRLNVIDIFVPPLRERRGDLPLLVDHFLHHFSKDDTQVPGMTPQAWAALTNYSFPGNVRELEHAIQHAVVFCRGEDIELEHLPTDIVGRSPNAPSASAGGSKSLSDSLKEFERQCLIQALNAAGGKKGIAAESLGISRKNLWEKLKGHGITDSDLG